MQEPTEKLLEQLDKVKEKLTLDVMEDTKSHQDKIQEIYEGFVEIYLDPTFRHSYANISKHLDSYGEDERDSLPVGVRAIKEYSEEKQNDLNASEDVKRVHLSICKLLDHLELECVRLNRMKLVKRQAAQAQEIVEEAKKINEETRKDAEGAQNLVTRIHEQSINILGIFSAVIIGFVAELSFFVKGFENLKGENFLQILLYSSFVGMLVFDTLFMLMFITSKIAGTSIGVRCRYEHCADCTEHKWWVGRLRCKYPYLLWFNGLCLAICAFLYIQIKP